MLPPRSRALLGGPAQPYLRHPTSPADLILPTSSYPRHPTSSHLLDHLPGQSQARGGGEADADVVLDRLAKRRSDAVGIRVAPVQGKRLTRVSSRRRRRRARGAYHLLLTTYYLLLTTYYVPLLARK